MFKYKKSALFVTAATLAFALVAGGELPYFLFYSVLFTALVSFVWSALAVSSLKFNQLLERSTAHVGEDVELSTHMSNKSLVPVPFAEVRSDVSGEISGRMPGSVVVSALPLSSKVIREKVRCRYRGTYGLGPVHITVSDVFGIFTWNRSIKCSGTLQVYPRIVSLKDLNINPSLAFGTVVTKQKVQEDYSSISDIRNYYPGDSLKKIHWKLSAKKGDFHVKNYDMSGSSEVCIFLNLQYGDYFGAYRRDIEEKAVECAASIANYTLSRNISTGLYTNSQNTAYAKGRDLNQFYKILDALMTAKSDGTLAFSEFLESKARLVPRGSSIITITPKIDQTFIARLLQLKESGFDVSVVYVGLEQLDGETASKMSGRGIRFNKVETDDDFKVGQVG